MNILSQMRMDVEALAIDGGRPVGSDGHKRARAHLIQRLHSLGLEPAISQSFELPFTPTNHDPNYVNLAARLLGQNSDLAPIALVAHYDTCGATPGADDNAAAIAILLQVAECLRTNIPKRDIWIVFPDAEEPPNFLTEDMGSTRFFTEQLPSDQEILFSIVLDLCGHETSIPTCEDVLVVSGIETSNVLAKVVESQGTSPEDNLRIIPTQTSYIGDLSDYHVLRNQKRPYLFLSCGEWEHYHGPGDTPEKLNYEKMEGIVDYIISVVNSCDSTEGLTTLDGKTPVECSELPWEMNLFETTQIEIAFLRQVLGPLAAELSDRQSIDKLVSMLRAAIYGAM